MLDAFKTHPALEMRMPAIMNNAILSDMGRMNARLRWAVKTICSWARPRAAKAAAIAYTLIETAKLNEIDPQAWLADVLDRIPDYKINRVDELLPWNCSTEANPGPDQLIEPGRWGQTLTSAFTPAFPYRVRHARRYPIRSRQLANPKGRIRHLPAQPHSRCFPFDRP